MDRIFVEWEQGAWISSLDPDFQTHLLEFVAKFGRPSKVEFRAAGEGWVGPGVCSECAQDPADCHCGEHQCPICDGWFAAEPGEGGRCPLCEACPCGCETWGR